MSNVKKESAMQVPFVTTVSFADHDGLTVRLQYGVAAPSEREARNELQRRLINQEIYNYSISEIRRATSSEAASLNLPDGSIILLN
ncbi:MAG TPA: hypothetical protein VHY10_03835 [Xanthobacteraceae bacterium]|jgi:hypothetical protein|nr:hypothetical protein [Xanthobacteraceae bacterium]